MSAQIAWFTSYLPILKSRCFYGCVNSFLISYQTFQPFSVASIPPPIYQICCTWISPHSRDSALFFLPLGSSTKYLLFYFSSFFLLSTNCQLSNIKSVPSVAISYHNPLVVVQTLCRVSLTLCDPTDCSRLGLSVAHYLLEFALQSPYPSIIFPYTTYQLLTSHTFICLFIFFFHLYANSL